MIKQKQNTVEETPRKPYLIYPDSCWKSPFDLFVSILLLYSCNVAPLQLAFYEDLSTFGWELSNYIIDGVFFLDIILSFFTVIVDDDLNEIVDCGVIAKNYLFSWFAVDFVSIIPFSVFANVNSADAHSNRLIRMTRLGKMYRILKIFRLMRVFRVISKG